MSTEIRNRYLEGNFGPVEQEVTAFDLPVTGRIPEQLDGRYLRNGPNPIGPLDMRTHHWFVGNGMVHGVRLQGGRALWYRNRLVLGDAAADRLGRPHLPGPRTGMFGGSAPNTNVIGHAGSTWAIVEAGGMPVELSDELESLRYLDFDGNWPGAFSAHPKRDPQSGELHTMVYSPEFMGVRYVVIDAQGNLRKVEHIDVPGMIMLHDVAITETKVVVFDLPVTLSMDALSDGYPFPYRWDPEYTPRVGVLPREGTAADIQWFEVEPCYVFHPMNAYDTADGGLVLDVSRHPRMFATDFNGPFEGPPTLDRWTFNPVTGRVSEQRIDDRGQEFPRVAEHLVGRRHRFGYSAGFGSNTGPELGGVIKHDLDAGITTVHELPRGWGTGEPVFIAREGGTTEDDGWLMTFIHDRNPGASSGVTARLMILDARDMAAPPVALVDLPARVPFGFHGNWIPA